MIKQLLCGSTLYYYYEIGNTKCMSETKIGLLDTIIAYKELTNEKVY